MKGFGCARHSGPFSVLPSSPGKTLSLSSSFSSFFFFSISSSLSPCSSQPSSLSKHSQCRGNLHRHEEEVFFPTDEQLEVRSSTKDFFFRKFNLFVYKKKHCRCTFQSGNRETGERDQPQGEGRERGRGGSNSNVSKKKRERERGAAQTTSAL